MTITIRPARAADAEAICRIHNQGIVDRTATLDTSLRTAAGCRQWLEERDERHPVLVADAAGAVAGWGSLNRFNPREAYSHVVDFSVYVERDCRGKGVGWALLDALVDCARTVGYHKMVLAALAHNAAGVALYRKAGFAQVGTYREQGQLDGRWVDVVIMEKLL